MNSQDSPRQIPGLENSSDSPDRKPPKIFLLYASAGAGHRSACDAIKHSLDQMAPGCDIRSLDILDYIPEVAARLYSKGYITTASKYPALWYLIYETGSDLTKFKPTGFWFRVFWQTLMAPLFHLLEYEKPDYIVSAHFLSSWAGGLYKSKYHPDCIVSTVVTDYGVHPIWINANQDVIFVPTEQLKAELSNFSYYLGTNRFEITGIPIHPKFNRNRNKEELRAKFRLSPDRRTILILGGMFGSENIGQIAVWLGKCRTPIQLVFVAGKYYPVKENLKELLVERNIGYQIYGYVDFMDELMAVSDLVITKAGALTTSECLAGGLPMVIFRPYPGQEERNCDYLLEEGAAIRIDQLPGLNYKVDRILSDSSRLQKMKDTALAIARPDAADSIAKIILEKF